MTQLPRLPNFYILQKRYKHPKVVFRSVLHFGDLFSRAWPAERN